MNLNKALLLPSCIVAATVSLGILGQFLPEVPEVASAPSVPEEPKFEPIDRWEPTILETKPPIYVPVLGTNIRRAWDNNRVRAEQNYNGVNVQVSGTVSSIKGGRIEISDDGGWSSLTCDYDDDQAKNVGYLNHNGPITVRGELSVKEVFGTSHIQINDCQVGPFR